MDDMDVDDDNRLTGPFLDTCVTVSLVNVSSELNASSFDFFDFGDSFLEFLFRKIKKLNLV
jgi:hypothetical protein